MEPEAQPTLPPTPCALTEKGLRFWTRVWDGRLRLTSGEDALVARMRARGASWNLIAAAIVAERRRKGREHLRRWRRLNQQQTNAAALGG